jgi:hypothetical protein
LRRDVGFGINCLNRALRNTCFTIDTIDRVDVKHRLILVETLHRADDNTIGVLAIMARLANGVSHARSILSPMRRKKPAKADPEQRPGMSPPHAFPRGMVGSGTW